MSLTRRLLKELELNDDAIERIIAAHVATVDALRTERDEALAASAALEETAAERDALRQAAADHQQEAERLRTDFDRYRRQVDEERHATQRKQTLHDALTRAGANAHAIPLLAGAIQTTDTDWDGAALRDERAVLAPVISQYAALFGQETAVPTDRVSPPLEGGALTREDVRSMSAEEINRNWSTVCSALTQHR